MEYRSANYASHLLRNHDAFDAGKVSRRLPGDAYRPLLPAIIGLLRQDVLSPTRPCKDTAMEAPAMMAAARPMSIPAPIPLGVPSLAATGTPAEIPVASPTRMAVAAESAMITSDRTENSEVDSLVVCASTSSCDLGGEASVAMGCLPARCAACQGWCGFHTYNKTWLLIGDPGRSWTGGLPAPARPPSGVLARQTGGRIASRHCMQLPATSGPWQHLCVRLG
jgi:hypothetical protein